MKMKLRVSTGRFIKQLVARTDTSCSRWCVGLSTGLPPPLFTFCCHCFSWRNIFNMMKGAVSNISASVAAMCVRSQRFGLLHHATHRELIWVGRLRQSLVTIQWRASNVAKCRNKHINVSNTVTHKELEYSPIATRTVSSDPNRV